MYLKQRQLSHRGTDKMADVRELENTTGSEFEAIVDCLEDWNCPIKVVGDWDRENESIHLYDTRGLLNEKTGLDVHIPTAHFVGSELITVLINHIKEGLA